MIVMKIMFYKFNSFWCQRLFHEVYPLCQTFVDEFNIADFQQFEDLFISICVIQIILEFSKPRNKNISKKTRIWIFKKFIWSKVNYKFLGIGDNQENHFRPEKLTKEKFIPPVVCIWIKLSLLSVFMSSVNRPSP